MVKKDKLRTAPPVNPDTPVLPPAPPKKEPGAEF
jgi:hypothetical protein